MDQDWRFCESEGYLRVLGALEETAWGGKRVVIANYLHSAANCIVTNPDYMVCCADMCEHILSDIEAGVGSPMGSPDLILAIVRNTTTNWGRLDEEPPRVGRTLSNQLREIANIHRGTVPLHGRLFAQWLHYVFPRECMLPHVKGSVKAISPGEYGESYMASDEEMGDSIKSAGQGIGAKEMGELVSLQWSSEEELVAKHQWQLQAPWEGSSLRQLLIGFTIVALVLLGFFFGSRLPPPTKKAGKHQYFA
eukprot:NODE_14504_length_1104_cov_6.034800.p1 GENE.NODE_14504_length_1104_cov_6.034800~~NODE_14504_length_1104_cov_6.034800.p1  ORF type:complete len:289 (-),score=70.52 NODE_14504_length_1104_cov_6.034800:236-985(-)